MDENKDIEKKETETETKTYTEDEVLAMIQSEADKRVAQALKTQQKKYEKQLSLAYMDEEARAKAESEDKIKELEANAKTSDSMYAIVSLDLNFLKHTNDTYGHEKGDELIRSFADVLTNVFGLYGSVMRTGGDEFIVILEDIAEEQVKKLLAQMLDELEEKNKTESEIKLSTAYGYAMSGETVLKQDASEELKIKVVDINPRTIYRIADDRMYENKRKSKLGRQ